MNCCGFAKKDKRIEKEFGFQHNHRIKLCHNVFQAFLQRILCSSVIFNEPQTRAPCFGIGIVLNNHIHMLCYTSTTEVDAYMHTYIHTYVQTNKHTNKQTNKQTYIHTYIHAYMHTNMHTYIHTYPFRKIDTCCLLLGFESCSVY